MLAVGLEVPAGGDGEAQVQRRGGAAFPLLLGDPVLVDDGPALLVLFEHLHVEQRAEVAGKLCRVGLQPEERADVHVGKLASRRIGLVRAADGAIVGDGGGDLLHHGQPFPQEPPDGGGPVAELRLEDRCAPLEAHRSKKRVARAHEASVRYTPFSA